MTGLALGSEPLFGLARPSAVIDGGLARLRSNCPRGVRTSRGGIYYPTLPDNKCLQRNNAQQNRELRVLLFSHAPFVHKVAGGRLRLLAVADPVTVRFEERKS